MNCHFVTELAHLAPLLLASSLVLGACGGSSTVPSDCEACDADVDVPNVDRDAGPDASLALTCRAISEQFASMTALLDRSCDVAADCVTLGGEPSYRFCNGSPFIGEHVGGTAASAAAFASSTYHDAILDLVQHFSAQCSGHTEICNGTGFICTADAAQFPTACVDHVCTEQDDSCSSGFDAGP